jgi:hypothetical protein
MNGASDPYAIMVRSSTVDALGDLAPGKIATATQRAINRTAQRGRTAAMRDIQTQVAFSSSYLAPSNGRLAVTKQATVDDLSAVITGRRRPTSLAQFAKGGKVGGKPGARIEVQPGLVKFLPRAFFVRLRSGNTDTLNNLGLAIRLPLGVTPDRAYKPTKLDHGLWLLFGPSVDSVFDDVAEDISPDLAEFLGAEFLRQMGLS